MSRPETRPRRRARKIALLPPAYGGSYAWQVVRYLPAGALEFGVMVRGRYYPALLSGWGILQAPLAGAIGGRAGRSTARGAYPDGG